MKNKTERRDKGEQSILPCGSAAEGVIIVDESFVPTALDGGAEAILVDLNSLYGRSEDRASFPPEILDLLQRTRSQGEANERHMQIHVGEREYSCRTFVLRPRTDGVSEKALALYLKREISLIDAVHDVGADYGLTDREQETLIGVTMGLTSKEVAKRMNISPNTVKAFLRLIMIKMGVTTRAGIVGKVLEQNGSHDGHASWASSGE